MKVKFEKEENNDWFVVLDNWKGDKSDLQMVHGADEMLDYLSENNDFVDLLLITNKTKITNNESLMLKFIRKATEYNNGAFYKIISEDENINNKEIWLCNVTIFVFGYFPRKIYITKV